jgi:hypothetical protein
MGEAPSFGEGNLAQKVLRRFAESIAGSYLSRAGIDYMGGLKDKYV